MEQLEGITYCHEHTTIDLSYIKLSEDTVLDCQKETIKEYHSLYKKGVRNIVDVTVAGMNRNPLYVKKVAEVTGIDIIQATGFYIEEFLPPMVRNSSIEQLAEWMIKEIRVGIEDSGIKARVIGEIGSSKNTFTENEQKVFEAAVIAQKETGVPIMTHAHLGTFGHEQVVFFKERNVELSKIVIGHADLSGCSDYVLHMLREGVFVAFDTIGKESYLPDIERAKMLSAIEANGLIDRVLLSMDITRKSYMEHKGGIGYSYLIDTFIPLMETYGIKRESIKRMLVDNPQEFFGL